MQLSARVLGTSTIAALHERSSAVLLTIGSDRFRRADLASIGCFNFIAAHHLSAAIVAIGGIKNTRDLFERIPPSAFVLPGIGPISIAVLGAAFEHKNIGGSSALESWMAKHRSDGAAREFVTFDTLKTQERKREPGESRATAQRRDRQHARRNQAQRLRVQRHTLRRDRTLTNGRTATH